MKKLIKGALNGLLIIGSLLFIFIALEIGFSFYQNSGQAKTKTGETPLYITVDKPYLYQMNPAHSRTNSYGLRDNEFSLKKPEGVFRILVLGDSIPYGRAVRSAWTFPNRLETLLNKNGYKAEVINAGVSGYTPYNELQYYLSEGKNFKPDLVILAFCMNDVVNPRLHWNYTQSAIKNIPPEAIPNKEYDEQVIQPLLKERDESISRKLGGAKSLLSAMAHQTRTYQFVSTRLAVLFPSTEQTALQKRIPDLSDSVPTYITGEDDLSIQVLTDPSSPEWRWLTHIYIQTLQATAKDGVPLVLTIFPLAYQLDEQYPYYPQKLFENFCNEQNILCLDLLPSFRQQGKEKIFMLDKERGYDVWHLTADGHAATGQLLFDYLQNKHLLKH